MRAQIAAIQRGELTEASYYENVGESVDRHRRWLDSLPPDRRAWLEAEEAEDQANRTFVVPEEIACLIPRVDMRAMDGASDPVRDYLRLQQEALALARAVWRPGTPGT